MRKINFEVPEMELLRFDTENIVCVSNPRFIKGNNAEATAGEKTYTQVEEELF